MNKYFSFFFLFLFGMSLSFSQNNQGILKGSVSEKLNNNPIPFASLQLFELQHDSLVLLRSSTAKEDGSFQFSDLNTSKKYLLHIRMLGFKLKEISASFSKNSNEINLGAIELDADETQLKTVEILEETPSLQLEMDKKIYNVDKNPIHTGGNAEDVLKNIPGLSVDMDGNVTINNSSPKIFVDGRPTTLTLEQIAADAIENVEVISNPSAKYDASGGSGGIIIITLKKNKKIGYSGSAKASIDMFGRFTTGIDFNFRKSKVNYFMNVDYNQRMSKSYGVNTREYDTSYTPVILIQSFDALFYGFTSSIKSGFDYFINDKNMITATYGYNQGKFQPFENFYVTSDSIYDSETVSNSYYRQSEIIRNSYASNASLYYKHSFTNPKHYFTTDLNYQHNQFKNENQYTTQNFDTDSNKTGEAELQQQYGNSLTQMVTAQFDYVNPLTEKRKIESGMRLYNKDFKSNTNDYLYDYTNDLYELIPQLTNNYKYNESIYAAYFIYSTQIKKYTILGGLRAEGSYYKGEIIDSAFNFINAYPLNIFPSAFISYKNNEKHNFQIGYSRRINRPNFFQLSPYIDYTDSLTIKRGNPLLLPEFTNIAEFNYQFIINENHNFLSTVYYKNTTGIITAYQLVEYSDFLGKDIIINSYENANASYSYGIEMILKNKIKKRIDLTSSINVFNATINASNLQENLINEMISWTSKLNMNVKLPFNFSYQLSASYFSKMITPVSGGSMGKEASNLSGGGHSWWNSQSSIVQGYTLARYEVDMGMKFEFLKNKAGSLTFNVSDIFKTKQQANFYLTDYYSQSVYRIRNPQFYRLNFSYKFGKQDPNLLKRKPANTEFDSEM